MLFYIVYRYSIIQTLYDIVIPTSPHALTHLSHTIVSNSIIEETIMLQAACSHLVLHWHNIANNRVMTPMPLLILVLMCQCHPPLLISPPLLCCPCHPAPTIASSICSSWGCSEPSDWIWCFYQDRPGHHHAANNEKGEGLWEEGERIWTSHVLLWCYNFFPIK